METTRIQNGQTEVITAIVKNNDNRPVIGLTDVLLSIRNLANEILDFNDFVFKSSGQTNPNIAMSEIVPTSQPSDSTGDTDGSTGVITGMTDTGNFKVGMYATVSNGFPNNDVGYKILAVTGSSITLELNSDSAENNITVLGWFQPGQYSYSFNTSPGGSPYSDDNYNIDIVIPTRDIIFLTIELKVGDYVDNINAPVSAIPTTAMRGTDGANTTTPPTVNAIRDGILDDATRFSGAKIDATISSRSSHSAAAIWAVGSRTLTSFGSLVADIWAYATRVLTAGTNLNDITAASVWSVGTRTLTSVGTLISDIWSAVTRTLTSGTKDSEIDTINTIVGNLPNSGSLNDLATLVSRLTSIRAGYLDNLSGGAVALASALDTVDTVINLINSRLPPDPADASDIAASHNAISALINALNDITAASVWAVGTRILTEGTKDSEIDTIQSDVIEIKRIKKNKLTINEETSELELWNDVGDEITLTWPLTNREGDIIVLQGTGPANRGVPVVI